jgi:hypothetical protein
MRYSGVNQCSGCPLQFSDLQEWRERRLRPRIASGTDAAASDPTPDPKGGTFNLT